MITLLLLAALTTPDLEGWELKNTLPTKVQQHYTPQPVEPAPVGPIERWRPLVEQYDGWNPDTMLNIIHCESRGNPTAQNPRSTATGLFQIMQSVWYPDGPRSDLHDPILNTEIAYRVWLIQGYQAWECWR